MKREQVIELGFKEVANFTVCGNLIYDLGRGRQLSLSCLGTPNEMLFMCCIEKDSAITDIVTLRNYDYDGALTIEDLKMIIKAIEGSKK